tara:strand:- start:184 stop:303 length:120 start_codon:yes stop_codon:yes gene_type:complete
MNKNILIPINLIKISFNLNFIEAFNKISMTLELVSNRRS